MLCKQRRHWSDNSIRRSLTFVNTAAQVTMSYYSYELHYLLPIDYILIFINQLLIQFNFILLQVFPKHLLKLQ